jgi:spiro-SPASM protein
MGTLHVDNYTDMKNTALINAVGLSSYALTELPEGGSVFSRVLDYCKTLPDVQEYLLITDKKTKARSDFSRYLKSKTNLIVRDNWSIKDLLECMREKSGDDSHIFYFYGDCPFLDSELTHRMFTNHLKYFADYSFADGYPYGLTPEILSTATITPLFHLADDSSLHRGSLFSVIKKDINSFDIETEISERDLRLLRVSLTADKRRNLILIERLMEKGFTDTASIVDALQKSPELMRTLPAFFNVQIVEGCPQNCSHCPYPKIRDPKTGKQDEMDLEDFQKILNSIESFCDDAVVSVSLWGEPAYHSRIEELIQSVLSRDKLDLIVESSGIGWQEGVFNRIKDSSYGEPQWIISLDAWNSEVYETLRGEGFDEAIKTVNRLKEIFPGRVYVQAVRMQENEDDMEHFFRNWKASLDNVIIQKYDHFCGKLTDKRVTDLSPLKRFPCWHVKRDVTVLLDGCVVLCREDLSNEYVLGNVLKEDLKEIWQRGEDFYLRHIKEDYPEICRNCDEYYTYNF